MASTFNDVVSVRNDPLVFALDRRFIRRGRGSLIAKLQKSVESMKSRNMVFEAVKRGKMMMPLKWHRCLREGPHARVSTRVCTRAPRLYGNCGQAAKVSYHTVYYLTADYDRRNCNYPASRIVSYEREREKERESVTILPVIS